MDTHRRNWKPAKRTALVGLAMVAAAIAASAALATVPSWTAPDGNTVPLWHPDDPAPSGFTYEVVYVEGTGEIVSLAVFEDADSGDYVYLESGQAVIDVTEDPNLDDFYADFAAGGEGSLAWEIDGGALSPT